MAGSPWPKSLDSVLRGGWAEPFARIAPEFRAGPESKRVEGRLFSIPFRRRIVPGKTQNPCQIGVALIDIGLAANQSKELER